MVPFFQPKQRSSARIRLCVLLCAVACPPAALAAPVVPTPAPDKDTPPAKPDPSRARSRTLLRQANDLFVQKDYAGALTRFRQAFTVFPSWRQRYNLGLTLDALGRGPEAAWQFERYLEHPAKGEPAFRLKQAEQRLAALRRRLASLAVTCAPAGARLTVNGQDRGPTPLAGRVYLEPGRYRVVLGKAGFVPSRAVFELAAGQHLQHRVTLTAVSGEAAAVPPASGEAAAAPQPPDAPHPAAASATGAPHPEPASATPLYRRWWVWTAVGAVVAGSLALGLSLGLQDRRVPEGPVHSFGEFTGGGGAR